MGWLYKHDPIDDPVAYLVNQYNHEGEHRLYHVLAAARVGNTVYMALKCTDKTSGNAYVFAAVILISNTRKHGFGYKDMDETMGPYECACPDRIMRLLSPVADIPNPSYAAEWRARVAAHRKELAEQRRKRAGLRPGSIVTLDREVSFRDGTTAAVFRLRLLRRKTPIFEPVDRPGFLCRLRAETIAAATITPADATDMGAQAAKGSGPPPLPCAARRPHRRGRNAGWGRSRSEEPGEDGKTRERKGLPHRRPPPQGIGLRPHAARALAPAARDAPGGKVLPEQQGG